MEEAPKHVSIRKRLFTRNPSERIEHQIPTFWAPIILILGIAIFVGMFFNFKALPTPLLIRDEITNPGSFIAERAQNYLRPLENLGPKVVGSKANEEAAVIIRRELSFIKTLYLKDSYHFMEVDSQVASGTMAIFSVSKYHGIENIIVKLSPKKMASTHSVLVNCHFDSAPTSPGGADDLLNCAVMLEILRVLASSDILLKHNIIFLFNGAEENGLQGAHAFVMQHKWAKEVKALINLEAAGNGGKEVLFQAGPKNPWLLQHYARVAPFPYGQVMAEEMFQSGMIPSDTDFRVFRDFGGIVGADFAHADNGYIYHTQFDSMRFIELGTYQHTGENILAYVKALANADEIYNIKDHADGKMVYFDYCGWFMISYTETVGIIINCILSAFGVLILALSYRSMQKFSDASTKDICKEIGWSFLAQLCGWILAVALVLAIAAILDAVGRPLSWYTSTWLLSGVYFLPAFLGLAVPSVILIVHKKSVLPLSHRVQMLLHGNSLILILLIVVLTGLGIRTAYLPLVILIMYEVTTIVNLLTGLQNKVNQWVYVHLAGQIIPLMFIMSISILLEHLLVPISARGGPFLNPELIVSVATAFLAILLAGFIMPLVALMRSPRLVLCGITSLIILFFIFVATPIGFPYGGDSDRPTPQRYAAVHTLRTLRNEDGEVKKWNSGVYLVSVDRNSVRYLKEHVPALETAIDTAQWCEEELVCGLPSAQAMAPYSHWIPLTSPTIMASEPYVQLELVASLGVDANTRRYHFKLTGPNNMAIYISPYAGASLVGWDLDEASPRPITRWGERLVYLTIFTYTSLNNSPLLFYVDVKAPDNWTGPRLHIAVTGQYLYHNDKFTPAFNRFLKQFPDWAEVTPSIATYDNWIY